MTALKNRVISLVRRRTFLVAVIALLFLVLLNYQRLFGPDAPVYGKIERQIVAHEFRAAWIATVANINWPSKPGLSVTKQKKEALALLDKVAAANLNAVILQVRPQADALYSSDLEPWSYYLSGEQGVAPKPFYDPLEFWIEKAHNRGLELHAWVNPYRAHHFDGGPVTEHSVVSKFEPEMIARLDNEMIWMNPAHPKVMQHSLEVIKDIVSRYDIDGLHYDDYFYPYPSYNKGEPFPDEASYVMYTEQGGELNRDDWRRDSVNQLVKDIYQQIKAIKPHVKVGISPFGIWRPGFPESIAGFDQYEKLYADAKLWLNQGWLDYFTPQLYWKTNKLPQSFPMLLSWWQSENTQSRHLWPGLRSHNVGTPENTDEVINQIMISRAFLGEQAGHVFWHVGGVSNHPHFAEILTNHVFENQALVPPSPWLDDTPPTAPVVEHHIKDDTVTVSWTAQGSEPAFKWLLYYQFEDKWRYTIFTKDVTKFTFDRGFKPQQVALVAVDRTGQQSERQDLEVVIDVAE